jgi:hypothetical protein
MPEILLENSSAAIAGKIAHGRKSIRSDSFLKFSSLRPPWTGWKRERAGAVVQQLMESLNVTTPRGHHSGKRIDSICYRTGGAE